LLGHGKVPFEVYESVVEKLDIVDEHGELWQNIAKTLGETGSSLRSLQVCLPRFAHPRQLEVCQQNPDDNDYVRVMLY